MSSEYPIDEAFQAALNLEDELGCVVGAHLHIEFLVDKLLALEFQRPEMLSRLHLDFSHRVTLLEAFGYLENLTKPLSALGKLRNDFAHKINFELTADRMDGLYNSFDSEGKEVIQEGYQRGRKNSEEKAPRKMAQLSPKERFILYAVSVHAMLDIAYKRERA